MTVPAPAIRTCTALAAVCALAPLCAQEEPAPAAPARAWQLAAFFWHASPNDVVALEGIRAALTDWGHPFELEVLQAEQDRARAKALLADLAQRRVDLVFAMGTQAALLAKEQVEEVPVVFTAVTNPVESRIVDDWDGSGRNLAGNSNWIRPQTVLAVFRLAVPELTKLGLLRSRASGVVSAAELRGMRRYLAESDAPAVEVVEEIVDDAAELPAAVRRLLAGGVQAIWIPIDFTVYQATPAILDELGTAGVPLVSSSLQGTRTGAAVGIHVDYAMLGKRAVVIALEVLEGARPPGEIPVGRVQDYRVVVNLAAARRCGFVPPLPLLVRADQIEEQLDVDEEPREAPK